MKSSILAASALIYGQAIASSWIFWHCELSNDSCSTSTVPCDNNYSIWVQYDGPNGSGSVTKSAQADTKDDGFGFYAKCPTHDKLTGAAAYNPKYTSDSYLSVIYRYRDPSAPREYPCPLGDLYALDGSLLLGHNDGSAQAPPDGTLDNIPDRQPCGQFDMPCTCHAAVVVNSP